MKLTNIEKLLNKKEITILIPSKKKFNIKNFIKYNILIAFNYNRAHTNSFILESFEQLLQLSYLENNNDIIVSVNNLLSVNKETRQLKQYLQEYKDNNELSNDEIDYNIKWNYKIEQANGKYKTILRIITNKDTYFPENEIFYAQVDYVNVITSPIVAQKIFLNNDNIENLKIISVKNTIICDNYYCDDLIFINKLNINNELIFKNQINTILKIFKYFFKLKIQKNIIADIKIEYKNKQHNIKFIFDESYYVESGLIISIVRLINHYFDISYEFKFEFYQNNIRIM